MLRKFPKKLVILAICIILTNLITYPLEASTYIQAADCMDGPYYYSGTDGVIGTYWAPADRYITSITFKWSCNTASQRISIDIWDGSSWVNVISEQWITNGAQPIFNVNKTKAVRFWAYAWCQMANTYFTLLTEIPSKTESDSMLNAANTAAINASNAYNAANTAAARVWDSSESKSAATLAKEARDKANQALTEINNVKNTVNNIQMSVGPQIFRVSGRNSATCTKTSYFDVVVQATGATEFRVKADTGSWSLWVPINSMATATGISGTGAHTIYVEARNTSGVTATGQIAIFRI